MSALPLCPGTESERLSAWASARACKIYSYTSCLRTDERSSRE
ncbi:hypothetical protein HMPREF1986_01273 [Oribacterium sp. oral taxon 078 str. F0263]|nr:hypothetical protein HMPREF1986_01273 [Oribacterium sp. oral taxon 078 str. F0263]